MAGSERPYTRAHRPRTAPASIAITSGVQGRDQGLAGAVVTIELRSRDCQQEIARQQAAGGGGRVPDRGADRAAGLDERGGDGAALAPGRAEDQDRRAGGVWRRHRHNVRALLS